MGWMMDAEILHKIGTLIILVSASIPFGMAIFLFIKVWFGK